ncbi:DNA polymerase III subunit alpha [Mycoplasma simbae]|uniref:DNA polymerase III subunit alpha n=1 Tax=Mycoplasma simbae TaxID=36744 RepID=UPI0004984F6A|nr:DNA polymerase III subunit alpha [Mycoplasma simbae]
MHKFVNLYNTTEYSFLNSLIRISDLVKKSKEQGLNAVCLTDHNNLFGLGLFLSECKKHSIKPIIGVDLDVKPYRFILLAKNYKGFQLINKLILQKSKNIDIEIEQIIDENIFVLDHPTKGYYALSGHNNIINNGNYFVNSVDTSLPNSILIKQNQVFNTEDNETLNIIQQIAGNEITTQQHNYFENTEIEPIFIERINKIIDECNFELPPKQLHLAHYENNDSVKNETIFIELLNKGLKRVKKELPSDKNLWHSRLTYEFDVIKELGFIDYFLIIQDLVNWAKDNNIAIGPGRGSAAGSFISYLLNITTINPLKYDLLFERFLNPGRVSWPDIDIDIQDDRRGEVFEYLRTKYGDNRVALISTFQTLGAKMAIRDVGRVLGISLVEINVISKTLSASESLKEAMLKNLSFQKVIEKHPKLLEHALKIEGLPRQQSFHPAGLIIAQEPIYTYSPVSISNDGVFQQVQLPMEYTEDFGLLKIDLLGLKTLTELQHIEQTLPAEYIFDNILKADEYKMALYDQKTFLRLNLGFTEGIFQLESPGMKKTISTVQINAFDDLYAIISLFRPGPMVYIKQYARNKEDSTLVDKIHPIYDEILAPTYGIMVYQEQIMLIAQKVAGLSFVEADFLRRAISKKDETEIKKYKTRFIEGASQKGLSKQQIGKIYANIERFAEYGFNKSHAVSYAFLTMKMAYYKTYYPLRFYAALISNSRGDQSKIALYVEEMRKQNIQIYSPDIKESRDVCVVKDKSLYLPFSLIKGFGNEGINKILKTLNEFGEFNDNLNETILRLRFAGITESALGILIKANVFRKYGHTKYVESACQTLLDCYKLVSSLTWPEAKTKLKSMGYLDLVHDQQERDIDYEANNENALLGMAYNAFATAKYEDQFQYKLNSIPLGQSEFVAVQVNAKRILAQKSYFVIELSDNTGVQVFFINNRFWDKFSPISKGDIIAANIQNNNGKLKFIDFEPIK